MAWVSIAGGSVEVSGGVTIEGVVAPTTHPPRGRKTLSAGGVAEQLVSDATPLPRGGCYVIPWPGNTGAVFVGDLNVSATDDPSIGAGMMLPYPIDDASKIWVIAAVAGEGVSFISF